MDDNDVIVSSVEIIKDRLYFATLKGDYKPKSTKNSKYFSIEEDIIYDSFFYDYGPFHLCHLFIFCMKLYHKLHVIPKSKKIVFFTSDNKVNRLNAAYLIGCYAIIYLDKSPEEIYDLVTEGDWELLKYRDVSGRYMLFEITLMDVFEGLHKAFKGGFFDFKQFNYLEYIYYEKVLNGDLNWIIPEKMLAFSGPHAQSKIKDDYPLHAPDHYHDYFRENNVSTVVRLNQKAYNAKQFTDFGFEHYELFFKDGSVPSDAIVDKFNRICEKAKGAVAVHCKAGLGRTGTLIACYLMKYHDFTAFQAISWLRICRPGSVIGFQQNFLIQIEPRMLAEGAQYRKKNGISEIPKFKSGIYSNTSKLNADQLNPSIFDLSANENSLDELENCPTINCNDKILDSEKSTEKVDKEESVSLDSIINSNKIDSVSTRSSNPVTRASAALIKAKNTYTANKNNFIMSNINNTKPVSKVQATYAPKKMTNPSTTGSVSPTTRSTFSFARGTMSHTTKVALTKIHYAKGNVHSQRANLARNRGQNLTENGATGRKDLRKKSARECSSTDVRDCDNNLNLTIDSKAFNSEVPDAMTNNATRKKIILKKKPSKSCDKDLKNNILSNSDSELDSVDTPLTNMSADSLENIPCKMATRRTKSKSPEPASAHVETFGNGVDVAEDEVDSQGTRLCHIKAMRKKVTPFSSDFRRPGVKTRIFTSQTFAKKK